MPGTKTGEYQLQFLVGDTVIHTYPESSYAFLSNIDAETTKAKDEKALLKQFKIKGEGITIRIDFKRQQSVKQSIPIAYKKASRIMDFAVLDSTDVKQNDATLIHSINDFMYSLINDIDFVVELVKLGILKETESKKYKDLYRQLDQFLLKSLTGTSENDLMELLAHQKQLNIYAEGILEELKRKYRNIRSITVAKIDYDERLLQEKKETAEKTSSHPNAKLVIRRKSDNEVIFSLPNTYKEYMFLHQIDEITSRSANKNDLLEKLYIFEPDLYDVEIRFKNEKEGSLKNPIVYADSKNVLDYGSSDTNESKKKIFIHNHYMNNIRYDNLERIFTRALFQPDFAEFMKTNGYVKVVPDKSGELSDYELMQEISQMVKTDDPAHMLINESVRIIKRKLYYYKSLKVIWFGITEYLEQYPEKKDQVVGELGSDGIVKLKIPKRTLDISPDDDNLPKPYTI